MATSLKRKDKASCLGLMVKPLVHGITQSAVDLVSIDLMSLPFFTSPALAQRKWRSR